MVLKCFLETKENKSSHLSEEGGEKKKEKKNHTRKKASKSQVLLKVQATVFIASSPVSLALENLQFSLG